MLFNMLVSYPRILPTELDLLLNMYYHEQQDGCHMRRRICLPFQLEHMRKPQVFVGARVAEFLVFDVLICELSCSSGDLFPFYSLRGQFIFDL